MTPEPLDSFDRQINAALSGMSKATNDLCFPRNEEKMLLEIVDKLNQEISEIQAYADKIIFLALNGSKQELHEAILDYRMKYPPLIESDDEHIKDES